MTSDPTSHEEDASDFDQAAARAVDLGNQLLDEGDETDSREIAAGLLAGAVQFWLYSFQPCGDPKCEACGELTTARERLKALIEDTREFAEDSEYFHSPYDANVGRA